MTKKKTYAGIPQALIPIESEVKNLLEMFEFYLTERQLGKSIDTLGETVRDMRHIIGRILIDHFLSLSTSEEKKFCKALASMLADRAAALPLEPEGDGDYCNYCISEILTPFEYAEDIKETHHDDPILQKILSLDIPILRPFDYGLKARLKLIGTKKKRKTYGTI